MLRRGVRSHLALPTLSVLALLLSILSPISFTQATAAPALVTCVNLQTGTERISHTGKCRYTQEAQANWHKNQTDSPIASGVNAKVITICSNKESSQVSYQVIRKKCARHQVTTVFSRSGALPAKPVIAEAVSFGHDSASLKLATDPAASPDAPIAFYTITSTTVDARTPIIVQSQKVYFWKDLSIAISALQASTRYTFTVSATTADGTSPVSIASIPVTTQAYVPPTPASTAAPVAAPAFTLTSVAETKTVNTSATGFTINSTGGAIASFAINATPPGMNFNTTTGALSGTPNTVASATAYTITATNSSGSATQTFTLTVIAVVYTVGQTGPGGGTIFYYSVAGFNCGPSFTATGSPTGRKCNYLESAPNGWNGPTDSTSNRAWGNNAGIAAATAIGSGYSNTLAMVTGYTDPTIYTAPLARSYAGNGYTDWYVPSKDEGQELYSNKALVTGLISGTYWTSSDAGDAVWVVNFTGSGVGGVSKAGITRNLRPIRAF